VSKRGRPRRILCDETSNKPAPSVPLGEWDSDFAWAFTAACVLHTLDYGTQPQKRYCEDYLNGLRRSRRGRMIDPLGKMRDPEFLEEFVARYAPGWNWLEWRDKIDDGEVRVKRFVPTDAWQRTEIPTDPADWATLPGKIYYGRSRSRNERISEEQARRTRHDQARVKRSITPNEPDAGRVHQLKRIIPTDPTTWPTLRELKLATAIGERTIKRIIANLRPAPRQAEIVTIPLRHKFSRCGAMPRRYGPRLIIGVLNEFVNQLPEFPIANEDQKRLRRIAMRARGVIASRFSRSRSST
jgi:hypothetical protein